MSDFPGQTPRAYSLTAIGERLLVDDAEARALVEAQVALRVGKEAESRPAVAAHMLGYAVFEHRGAYALAALGRRDGQRAEVPRAAAHHGVAVGGRRLVHLRPRIDGLLVG